MGLECKNGHCFFVQLELELSSSQTRSELLDLRHNSRDKEEIAATWLTDPSYRYHLAFQLAEILRLFLEIMQRAYNKEAQRERDFSFCPICADNLETFTSPYIDSTGRQCGNGHSFGEQESKLCQGEFEADLEMDMDSGVLFLITNGWLRDDGSLKEQLPQQVRELLEYFINELDV